MALSRRRPDLLDNDSAQLFVEDFPQAQLFTVFYENLSMR
jgi:hypothetical protein